MHSLILAYVRIRHSLNAFVSHAYTYHWTKIHWTPFADGKLVTVVIPLLTHWGYCRLMLRNQTDECVMEFGLSRSCLGVTFCFSKRSGTSQTLRSHHWWRSSMRKCQMHVNPIVCFQLCSSICGCEWVVLAVVVVVVVVVVVEGEGEGVQGLGVGGSGGWLVKRIQF